MSLRWQACSRAEKCGHTCIGAPVLQLQGAEMDEITLPVVQRAVAGERAAMEQIMRALEQPFFNLAQRMLLSPPEAEDATQECLLRVATRLAQFEGGSRFWSWAWKVAVNRIVELKRKPLLTFEQFSADLADVLEPDAPERTEELVGLVQLT